MRLIDADVLIEELKKWLPKENSEWLKCGIHPLENLSVSAILTIEEQPTVESVPVVHGEWIKGDLGEWKCSVCREENCYAYDENLKKFTDSFCPNCGADMRNSK